MGRKMVATAASLRLTTAVCLLASAACRPTRAAASTDADPVNDDRAWRGQYREIFAGIVLIGHQRCRLTGLVEGLAEETVPGGGRGLERGGWFESVFGQKRELEGDGTGCIFSGN